MKKALATVLCAAMMLIMFAGCSGAAVAPSASATLTPEPTATPTPSPTEPPVVLCMASASVLSETNKGDALEKGFDDIKSWSSGALTIDFYEGGEKGTDAEIIEDVKSGDISIYTGDASMMKEVIPQLQVLDLPMMFSNLSACNTMLSGSFIEMMQPYFTEAGFQLIGAYSSAFRNLTVKSEDRLDAAEDIEGLRINTDENEYYMLFWQTAGCNVFTLTDNQLFTATKQGLLNGQEGTYAYINRLKLYDSQSDLIKTRHAQPVGLFVMNKAQYDDLTDTQKEWLEKFIAQVEKDEITAVEEDEAAEETLFKKKLLRPYEPSQEILEALKDAVPPVVELMKQSVDPDLVDRYIAACRQAETDAANAAANPTDDPPATDTATASP
jgi:TRAP-type C4-dicarboxylate transport system substrate-binding protein